MSISDFLTQGNPPASLTNPITSISGYPDWLQTAQQQDILDASQIAGAAQPIYQGQQLANFNNQQNQAFGLASSNAGTVQPGMQQGINQLGNLSQGFNQSQFNQYANPYIQQTNNAIANAGTQNLLQNTLPAVANSFIQAGQFGSQQQGNTTAQLTNAEQQNVMNTQATTDLAAQQQAMQSYLQGQQLAGTAATNQIAGESTLQNANTTDMNNLLAAGNQQQNLNQQGLNIDYSNFENQANYPLQQLGIMQSAIQGTSVPTQQTMYLPSLFNSSNSPSSGASAYSSLSGLANGISGLAKGGQFKPKYASGGAANEVTPATAQNTIAPALQNILQRVAAMKIAGAVPDQQPHILKANPPQRPGLGDMFMPVEGQERPSWYDTQSPQQQQAQNQQNQQVQQSLNDNQTAQGNAAVATLIKQLSSQTPQQAKGGLAKMRFDDGGSVPSSIPPSSVPAATIASLMASLLPSQQQPQSVPAPAPDLSTTGSTPPMNQTVAALKALAQKAGAEPMPSPPTQAGQTLPPVGAYNPVVNSQTPMPAQQSAPQGLPADDGQFNDLMAQKMALGKQATQQLLDASQGLPQKVQEAYQARNTEADAVQKAIADYIAKAKQNNPNLDTYSGINNPLYERGLAQSMVGTTGDNAGWNKVLLGMANSGIEQQQQSQDFANTVKNLMIQAAMAKGAAATGNAEEDTGLAEKAATASNNGVMPILSNMIKTNQGNIQAQAAGNEVLNTIQGAVDAIKGGHMPEKIGPIPASTIAGASNDWKFTGLGDNGAAADAYAQLNALNSADFLAKLHAMQAGEQLRPNQFLEKRMDQGTLIDPNLNNEGKLQQAQLLMNAVKDSMVTSQNVTNTTMGKPTVPLIPVVTPPTGNTLTLDAAKLPAAIQALKDKGYTDAQIQQFENHPKLKVTNSRGQ